MEVWKPHSIDGYEVSDHGGVRSIDREFVNATGATRRYKGQLLNPGRTPKGYLVVKIKGKMMFVHRLVLETFVSPCPPGQQARHLNDIKDDNRLENLRWGTPPENQHDRIRNGNHNFANKTHCPKGHPYSGDNLGNNKRKGYETPGRRCLTCHRDRSKARRRERSQTRL